MNEQCLTTCRMMEIHTSFHSSLLSPVLSRTSVRIPPFAPTLLSAAGLSPSVPVASWHPLQPSRLSSWSPAWLLILLLGLSPLCWRRPELTMTGGLRGEGHLSASLLDRGASATAPTCPRALHLHPPTADTWKLPPKVTRDLLTAKPNSNFLFLA